MSDDRRTDSHTMPRRCSTRAASMESFKVMDVLRRANQLQAEGHNVLHCEIGQPQTGAPQHVVQAAQQALAHHVLGYTDAFGLLALRHKIAAHYQSYYPHLPSTAVPDAARIVVTTGSSGAFLLAFTACFDAGDVVAIASSGYPCYRNILTALGCVPATLPLNTHFQLTAVELREAVAQRAAAGQPPIRGLILSSPGNPTGAMLEPDALRELCVFCEQANIQFLSDEIYHGISYGKPEATALQYSNQAIVINSFSKYYSMSGWRLGWMILPAHLVEAVNALQQNMFINAPTVAQTAALACWDDSAQEELQAHVTMYTEARAFVLQQLAQMVEIDPANIAPADGGFYVYIDLGEDNVAPGFGAVAMCQALLEEHHVALTPGIDFEDPASGLGDRRFRISYAAGLVTARAALERFRAFWPTWLQRVQSAKDTQPSTETV